MTSVSFILTMKNVWVFFIGGEEEGTKEKRIDNSKCRLTSTFFK